MHLELVRVLHQRTDLSARLCHAALVEGLEDVELAILWLREQGHLSARNWMWEQQGRGPDAFCALHFAPTAGVDLRDVVAASAPCGMTRLRCRPPMDSEFRAPLAIEHDRWVDWLHAEAVGRNLRGEASANVWFYSTIAVCRGVLWLENGYSYAPPECMAAQIAAIEAALGCRDLTLEAWSVEFGGQGYPTQVTARGVLGRELCDYVGI